MKKPSSVVTRDQPLFDPGTSTSGLSSGVTVGGAGPSLAQTTGEAAFVSEAGSKCSTRPVEGLGTEVVRRGDHIQQDVTQPVEAPSAGPEVLLSGTGSAVQSDSEEDLQSEPGSPAGDEFRYGSPDKDVSGDQEPSVEASYRETIRGGGHSWAGTRYLNFDSLFPSPANREGICEVGCRRLALNLTVTEGYPSRNTDTAGLLRDQFVKPPRSSR